MPPSVTFNDIMHCDWGYVELPGQVTLAHSNLIQRPYSDHFRSIKFSVPDRFPKGIGLRISTRMARPSLVFHILGVFSRRTNKQVLGIYARRVVAFVADKHAFGDWSVSKCPCKAMRTDMFPFAIFYREFSVPFFIAMPYPKPAIIRLVDLPPEAVIDWLANWIKVLTSSGEMTTQIFTVLMSVRIDGERLPTPTGAQWDRRWFCKNRSHIMGFDTLSRLPFNVPAFFISLGNRLGLLTATALTKAKGYGRMFLHLKSPIQIWGAMLRGVTSTAGAFVCSDYSIQERAWQHAATV